MQLHCYTSFCYINWYPLKEDVFEWHKRTYVYGMWKCDNALYDLKCIIFKCVLRFLRPSRTIILFIVGYVPSQSTVPVPVPAMKTPPVLNSTLDAGRPSTSRSGHFTFQKEQRCPLKVPEPVWTLWEDKNLLLLPGSETLSFQPVDESLYRPSYPGSLLQKVRDA